MLESQQSFAISLRNHETFSLNLNGTHGMNNKRVVEAAIGYLPSFVFVFDNLYQIKLKLKTCQTKRYLKQIYFVFTRIFNYYNQL